MAVFLQQVSPAAPSLSVSAESLARSQLGEDLAVHPSVDLPLLQGAAKSTPPFFFFFHVTV